MSGWPAGLIPNTSVPFSYSGDGVFHAWMAQRVTEGWLFENPRSGYPFGSNFLDYPGSDFGNHFLIKVLSLLSGSSFAGINLFYLFGFPVAFAATFCTVRCFGLGRALSASCALIYTFLPFHFMRLGHLFYTWYFVAPLFFYIAYSIFLTPERKTSEEPQKTSWLNRFAEITGLLILASFGVYYALFGLILVALAGGLNWLRTGKLAGIKRATLIAAILVGGVIANVTPNLIGKYVNGANPEVAQRHPLEAEQYGFKLMQLLLPRADHRISEIGAYTKFYSSNFPLINENYTSTLGIIGATGLILCFLFILASITGKKLDLRIGFLTSAALILFMFGTTGGLGVVFSSLISSSIRGWNRISVFLAFAVILVFFLVLQSALAKHRKKTAYSILAALLLSAVGFFDQTTSSCEACIANTKTTYENDKFFVASMEESLPKDAAIYQLPYMPFPENPLLNNLRNYQLTAGVLHSTHLNWSFGGMRGRDGDMFYRALSQEPIEKQLEVIRRLGFNGIYIDRRGYVDDAKSLIDGLTALLGTPPTLVSKNNQLVFFKIDADKHQNLNGMSVKQIMDISGYHADHLGRRYNSTINEGINFSRAGWPDFIRDATGFSGNEPWGRWSDQNISSRPSLKLYSPLPQKFTLVLSAQAFARNANSPVDIVIGNQKHEVSLANTPSEVRVKVDLQGETADSITFVPAHPISPKKLKMGTDSRKLGIGFISMRIEPN
ncbi:sugar translocase [Pseudomonas alkylphenolica]|nr:sugar translocase [Pseudomonas alkylphenolica]